MDVRKVTYIVLSVILGVLVAILGYTLISNKTSESKIEEDLTKIEQMNNFEYEDVGSYTGTVNVIQSGIKEVEAYLSEEEKGYISRLGAELSEDLNGVIESGHEDYVKLGGIKMTCTSSEYELSVDGCLADTLKYLINSNEEYEEYYTRGINKLDEYMEGRIKVSNYLKESSEVYKYLNVLDKYEYEYLQKIKDKTKYVGDYGFEEMEDEINGIEVEEGFSIVENDRVRNKLIRYYNITEKE